MATRNLSFDPEELDILEKENRLSGIRNKFRKIGTSSEGWPYAYRCLYQQHNDETSIRGVDREGELKVK